MFLLYPQIGRIRFGVSIITIVPALGNQLCVNYSHSSAYFRKQKKNAASVDAEL